MENIPNRRELIDRKKLVLAINDIAEKYSPNGIEFRGALLDHMKSVLADGEETVKRRFLATNKGRPAMYARSFLIDQIIRTLYDTAVQHIYRLSNPTTEEKLSIVAVGGYGRGELAPYSDIDLLFMFPYKQTSWCEQVVEFILYMLWDLGLKVGHSTRNVNECIRMAKSDITIQTALLEARHLWGDQDLFSEMRQKYFKEIVSGNSKAFIESKLQERGERHERFGNSRYVVEPNMKEGKGGLRDLHTLFWIAKFVHGTTEISRLVELGVLT
ncbi:MAG: bifunctional uridylyltransferase/uridylyl-removing protein, partial [Sneathiella sp.]